MHPLSVHILASWLTTVSLEGSCILREESWGLAGGSHTLVEMQAGRMWIPPYTLLFLLPIYVDSVQLSYYFELVHRSWFPRWLAQVKTVYIVVWEEEEVVLFCSLPLWRRIAKDDDDECKLKQTCCLPDVGGVLLPLARLLRRSMSSRFQSGTTAVDDSFATPSLIAWPGHGDVVVVVVAALLPPLAILSICLISNGYLGGDLIELPYQAITRNARHTLYRLLRNMRRHRVATYKGHLIEKNARNVLVQSAPFYAFPRRILVYFWCIALEFRRQSPQLQLTLNQFPSTGGSRQLSKK